jgi:hypothetical protein
VCAPTGDSDGESGIGAPIETCLDAHLLICQHSGTVPGASDQTRRLKSLNANWVAGPDGDDGHFEFLLVTEDDQEHIIAPSPAAVTALVALTQADGVLLLWDPADRTIIAANVVGQRLPRPNGSAIEGSR